MSLKPYINTSFLFMGLMYTALFHSVWLISTQFEIIASTVSWYLPAGVRFAAFMLLPLRSWPILLFSEKLTHFVLFHPGGILDNTAFLSGSLGWYLVHLLLSPALLCTSVYIFRRCFKAPYISNINSTLATLGVGLIISVVLGAVFIGRRAIELQTDITVFFPLLFDFSLGDFVGLIVLCPLLFVLYDREHLHRVNTTLYWIIGAWLFLLLLSSYAYSHGTNISYQVKYLAVFPALFLSYRYAVTGSALSCLLVGVTAFVVAIQSDLSPLEHQFYIIALCVSCLILGASVNHAEQMGGERLMGPVFKKVTHFIGRPHNDDEFVELEVYAGGMVAVEAELVFELGKEITPGSIDTKVPLKHLINAVYAGVEIASSPVIDLNSYGPTAIISDFGVNQGMVVGAPIEQWDSVIENIQTSVFINNEHINSAPSNNVLRGPMAAVAYLIDQAAARNITLPKGCMICSGAITGVHDTVAGASATVSFEGIGNINMKLIPVTP